MAVEKRYKIYFRHEKIREFQKDLINDVYDVISSSKNLVAHAPTGIGKTDAVLSPAITLALEEGLNIFFLTPKISQHKIAVDVVKDLIKRYDIKLRVADIIGRRYSCVDPVLRDLDYESFYTTCEKRRKKETCPFYKRAKGYTKADMEFAEIRFKEFLSTYGAGRYAEEVVEMAEEEEACAYEWLLKIASVSQVIIADYLHLFSPRVRDVFLLKTKKKLKNSIIIVDEAHNLPKRIREQLSSTINTGILKRVEKEMSILRVDGPKLQKKFDKWANGVLGEKEEVLISTDEFLGFMDEFGDYEEMIWLFENIGVDFVEKMGKKSRALKLSRFLENWKKEDPGVIRILKKLSKGYSLSKRYLDPASATGFLKKSRSAILMSGTLKPMEMYRDLLGLSPERTKLKEYGSPFPQKNRMNIIGLGVTTKYTKRDYENYKRIAERIDDIISASPKGVAVFFPSYNVMNSVIGLMKTRDLLVQRERMSPKETLELLKRFKDIGGVLCGVQGGSFSEGVDYSQGEIKTIIIVGVPLEEMSLEVEALIEYYEEKFGKGWEYGYIYPAVMKALQAAGRGIRKEKDRCAVVFLDERFKWKNYYSVLNNGERFIITNEPEKYVQSFWKEVD